MFDSRAETEKGNSDSETVSEKCGETKHKLFGQR